MIDRVVKKNLCTNCGTCISVCPFNAIFYEQKENSFEIKVNWKKCRKCGLCLKVCPGLGVDFENLNKEIFKKDKKIKYNPNLGNFRNCYLGYSRDRDIRFQCSSGGTITSILIYLLKNKIIDGALVTTMDFQKPLISKPFIAYTEEEIIEARGSKYTPVLLNQCLKEIIKSKKKKFAVVGLPCHIQGIRKFQKINPALRKKIKICLGLVCGQEVNFSGTKFILRQLRTKSDEVKKIEYRGDSWPGDIAVFKKNGKVKRFPFPEIFRIFTMGFFTPERCFLCTDFTNELADISFGDAWIPKLIKRKQGVNFIITRTKLGQELLEKTRKSIYFKNIDPGLVIKTYNIRLFCKKRSHKLFTTMANLFKWGIPKYSNQAKSQVKPVSISLPIFYLNSYFSNRYSKFFLRIPLIFWNLPILLTRKILDLYKRSKS